MQNLSLGIAHNPLEDVLLKQWADKLHENLWSTLTLMSRHEDWIYDRVDDDFLMACIRVAKVFDTEIRTAGIFIQTHKEKLAFIYGLAYLNSSKSMRLLNLAGQRQPGLGGDIIQVCTAQLNKPEGERHRGECNIVLSRLKQIVKMECYQRMFGRDRRRTVLKFFEEIKNEESFD